MVSIRIKHLKCLCSDNNFNSMTKTNSDPSRKTFDYSWLLSQASVDSIPDVQKIILWNDDVLRGIFRDSENILSLKLGTHVVNIRECDAWFSSQVYHHIFKEKEHLEFEGFTGENTHTILDLGANIGLYALAIKDVNPDCQIICLEPNPHAFELLQKNISANNLHNIVALNKGAAQTSGSFVMKILKEGTAYCGKYLDEIKKEFRKWIKPDRIISLPIETLSIPDICVEYALDKIDILKMDVEGMEFEILEGCVEIFPKIKRIVVEWHGYELRDQIKKLLQDHNFDLVHDDGRDFGNLYFVNKGLLQ